MTRSRFLPMANRALRAVVTLSVLISCALYPVSYTAAQGSATATLGFKHGKVMARQLVLGPNGKPIFAEFDQVGEVVNEIGEATEENKLQGALVMPGSMFRSMVASFDELRQHYADAVIMTRAQFEATTFAFSQSSNASLQRPPLASQVKTVLVRVSGTVNGRTLVPTHEFVLDTYPMVLPIQQDQVTVQTLAVLIDSDGLVRRASNNNIGFRAAWISDHTDDTTRDNVTTRQSTEKPLGPVAGALVYVAVNGTGDITGADGDYSVQHMILPCPGSSYEIQNAVVAELRTQNFNPRGTYVSTYAVQVPFYITCYGGYANLAAGPTLGAQSAFLDSEAIMATQASISPPLDIKIDVMSLAGQGVLSNDGTLNDTIPVADETAYATAAVTFSPFNPTFLDLNADGRADQTFLCGDKVKVYFEAPPASQDPCVAQADVTRLADRPADFTDQGLLRTITEADLEQTDLYVFRMSNGKLISERKGLKPPTTTYQSSGVSKNPDGSASNQFFYNMLLRGPRDLGSANPMNTLSFTEWQTRSGIKDPALLERSADHLRVGEQIKIIAINRVTGYIGSVVTTLQNAAGNQSGALRIGADKIVLGPPNLRIKAERTSFVEAGLTKGEQRDYLIGFEGSALKSDHVIALSTEWVDVDGSPLPDGLPGYTARLAKAVEQQKLGGFPPTGDLADFEIKPGKHMQLIALPDDAAISNDHFYLHVCGARYIDRSECANYYNSGRSTGGGPLQYRPQRFVPVRVPLYDEALTQFTKLQLRDSLNNAQSDAERQQWLDALRNADPNYRWPYRPEMQFSVFDLKVKHLNRTDADDTVIDIFPAGKDNNNQTIPGLASSDQQLQLLYDLVGSEFEVLPPFGPGRELVFALGEEELRAVVGTDGDLIFTNLDHLAALQPEDFLSLRLYQNSDPENVLWKFAFEALVLESQIVSSDPWVGDTYVVTADDPTVPLIAHLVGYGLRDPQYQEVVTTRWSVEGSGTMDTAAITNQDGVFLNKVTLPHRAGSQAVVRAALIASPDVVAKFATVEVVPGEPDRVEITTTGRAAIAGVGKIDVTIRAWDKWGNAVTDGTSLEASIEGDARVYPDVAFKDGVAEAVIEGGLEPGTSNFIVRVGKVTTQQTLTIDDLNVAITLGDTLTPGQLSTVQVNVTTQDGGAPTPPVKVELVSTLGMLQDAIVTTGSDGTALTYLHPGFYSGDGKLTAVVNLTRATKNFTVATTSQEALLSAKGAVVLGSETTDGSTTVTRYDGTNVSLGYRAATSVSVGGAPGATVRVALGDRYEPVIEPVRVFELNSPDVIDQATGVAAQVGAITVVNAHPRQIGKSVAFDGNGILQFASDASVNRNQNLGVRFAFYPQAVGGTLIDHENGTQLLTLDADGRLTYRAKTTSGTVSISSAPVTLNTWHRISARYVTGQLELEVDGMLTTVAASGDLAYNSTTAGVKVAHQYTGYLSGLRWYDWNAPALLAFANGQQSIDVTVDAAGHAAVPVQSTGQLGKTYPDHTLPGVAVAIHANGLARHVSLLSASQFASLGVNYLENAYYGAAPPLARNTTEQMLDVLIAPAHADFFDSVWSGLVSVVEFLIPIEAMGNVVDQLRLLSASDARFDASKLIFSSLEVLTIFPIAKPLLPIVKAGGKVGGPIVKLLERFKHYNTLKYLADYVGQAAKHVIDSRSFDKFVVLLPFFITVGEMYVENPESVEIMLRSIGSAADLEGWISYLFLPTEESAAELSAHYMSDPEPSATTSVAGLSSFFVKDAHARGFNMRRFKGGIVARVLVDISRHPSIKQIIDVDPKILSTFFREAAEALRRKDLSALGPYVADVRKYLMNPKMLAAAIAVTAKAGVAHLRAFVKGTSQHRVSFTEIVAIIAYLEFRHDALQELVITKGIPRLYAQAFLGLTLEGDIKGGKKPAPTSKGACDVPIGDRYEEDTVTANAPATAKLLESGDAAMFQLSQVAALDFAYSQGKGLPVKQIEGSRNVTIPAGKAKRDYRRDVDIVLGQDPSEEKDEEWVETKSYLRDGLLSKVKRKWEVFTSATDGDGNLKKQDTTPQRQFFLDRVHAGTPGDQAFEKMQWRFHEFTIQPKGCSTVLGQGADATLIGQVRSELRKIPKIVSNPRVVAKTFNIDITAVPGYKLDFEKSTNIDAIVTSRKAIDGDSLKDFLPTVDELASETVNQ